MSETVQEIKEEEKFSKDLTGKPKIAYFSMEIGVDKRIPTYSGGLGILAGDTLKSCGDLNIPIIGLTLLSEHGYFYQNIDSNGNQIEDPINFNINDFLKLLPSKSSVTIEDRKINIQIWYYLIKGINGYIIPIFYLDTNIEGNAPQDREITQHLGLYWVDLNES